MKPLTKLRHRREFRDVYDKGTKVAGRHLVVFARVRGADSEGRTRLGVTASRKVGGAVVRSRCRRRLRALFRLHGTEIADLALDVVINARQGCARAPWTDLQREFVHCLKVLRSRLESPCEA